MREDLAREFPEAVRALSWTRARLPARASMFGREPVLWATVSAIGAGFLVSAIAHFLVGLGFIVVEAFGGTRAFTPAWPSGLLGTAAAVAVALRAGGARSVALYLVFVAAEVSLQLAGLMTFCERSVSAGPLALNMCTPLGFIASHWAVWSGIGLGLLLSRAIAARQEGRNLTLRVAGTYAIAWSIALRGWSLSVMEADPAGALNASLTISVLAVAAGVAAGVVAARSEHRARTASVVAVILLLQWLTTQLPLVISQSAMSSEFLPAVIVGALMQPIAAIVLVLTALVADRRRFIPRDTA